MPKFTKFCFVCKEHIEIDAETEKAANQVFSKTGHDDVKTNKLQRGFCGKPGDLRKT